MRCEEFSKYFLERGYKKSIIERAVKRASLQPRADTLIYTNKDTGNRVPFVITHNPRNPPLRQILS